MEGETVLHAEWLNWPAVRTISELFARRCIPLYFAGGAVRDALIGGKPPDIDAVTSIPIAQVRKLLADISGITCLPTQWGVKFRYSDILIDINTLCETARYEPDDGDMVGAMRRYVGHYDFTINGVFCASDGRLYDFYGGGQDVRAGYIRFIHPQPMAFLKENHACVLRFFRVYAQFGRMPPESAALDACIASSALLAMVPPEKKNKEMQRLLGAFIASDAIGLMHESGVWDALMGFAIAGCATLKRLERIERELKMPPQVWPRMLALIMEADVPAEEAVARSAQALGLSMEMQRWMQRTLACLAQLHGPGAERNWQDLRRSCSHTAFTLLVALRWAMEEAMEARAPHYRAMLGRFD